MSSQIKVKCPLCSTEISGLEGSKVRCKNCLQEVTITSEAKSADRFPLAVRITSSETGKILTLCFQNNKLTLGRECLVPLGIANILKISGTHCQLTINPDGVYVLDCNSKNGTKLGNLNVGQQKPVRLDDKTELTLGREVFRLDFVYPQSPVKETVYAEKTPVSQPIQEKVPEQVKPEYLCRNCRIHRSQTKPFVCPKCNTYNP